MARFADHEGFDGVILGHPGAAYHLEFTCHRDHQAQTVPDPDHLLVFYVPDRMIWQGHVDSLTALGYQLVPALNPYWDCHGLTFTDQDGWRIVLQNTAWTI